MAMIVANFTGGEAEELRRAVGMRRSMARMRDLDGKLRRGMTDNGIDPKVQDEIIHSISSFALYGFPESHAASFALIAYASAYIKCNYLAAFTAALLNNQPMGFYSPATIVKDAQRHGLRVKPVDVQYFRFIVCVRAGAGQFTSLRGAPWTLLCARITARDGRRLACGKRAERIHLDSRPCVAHARSCGKSDLALLAKIGALNSLGEVAHRRDALWQAEYAGRPAGPLLDELSGAGIRSFSAAADDDRRAAGGGFRRHRGHGGQASHGFSSSGAAAEGHPRCLRTGRACRTDGRRASPDV